MKSADKIDGDTCIFFIVSTIHSTINFLNNLNYYLPNILYISFDISLSNGKESIPITE